MQLPSAWRFFVLPFLLEFQRKSSILACFVMQLPPACRFFRGSISARISTKSHRFWRAFWCNYLRRDDFLWFNFCSNFDENSSIFNFVWISTKNHRFLCAFWCNYLWRVDSLWLNFGSNSNEKLSIFACLLMQLPAACWFFRGSIAARVSTKNRRFWCAFPCN